MSERSLRRFGDAGAYPVLLLAFIYAVEQLDLQTFSILAPEITVRPPHLGDDDRPDRDPAAAGRDG